MIEDLARSIQVDPRQRGGRPPGTASLSGSPGGAGRGSTELDDTTLDLSRFSVLLAVREPDLGHPECACSSVGHEQVGPGADPFPDRVLEQSVCDGHRRAEQVTTRSDRLAYCGTPMEHHLEVEVRDGGARLPACLPLVATRIALLAPRVTAWYVSDACGWIRGGC